MRFMSSEFLDGIRMGLAVSGTAVDVKEYDRGTDNERLVITNAKGTIVMRNDLPIAPGDKVVFVTTWTPGPEIPISIKVRQHRPKAKRKPKKVAN